MSLESIGYSNWYWWGVVAVTEGQVANQVLVMQGQEKVVVLFNVEEYYIEKMWYWGTVSGSPRNVWDSKGDHVGWLWGDKEYKVEKCEKL